MSAVLSVAGALVVVLDPSGRIVEFNRKCEETTGHTFAEAFGRRLWDFVLLPEEAEEVRAVFGALRSGQFPNTHENYWLHKDGSRRLIEWSNTALTDGLGEVAYVIGTGIDVTDRRLVEASLRDSEERYRLVVEHLHEGIWLIDNAERTTFVNRRMAEMLGYTVEEMLGRSVFDFLDDEGAAMARQILARRPSGIEGTYEFALVRKDGGRIQTLVQASPVTDESGEYRGSLAGIVDITDRKRMEIELRRAHDELELRVQERTEELRLALADVARLKERVEAENIYLRQKIQDSHDFVEIVGQSPPLREALGRVSQVAPTPASVLILGETGTGKELVARAIHTRSPRAQKPFVKVNCAGFPSSLIENELFGHERGAFTGAQSRAEGRFSLADGGTIFLDEVGDLPIEVQAKLLRVLQDGEFERLGSAHMLKVDVRLIAATNRDLEAEVFSGSFRRDLFYRLSVFPIVLPPLRERREDIPVLVWHFIGKKNAALGKRIENVSPAVMEALKSYDWPGNIRELENVVERAMILSPGPALRLDESFDRTGFSLELRQTGSDLGTVERDHILRVLEQCRGRVKGKGNAAEQLGLHPSTLRDRMRKLGIARPGRGT